MNIGFDVDGVLTDIYTFQMKYGKRVFGRSAINKNCYDIKDMFGCTETQRKGFWIKSIWRYGIFEKPRDYASEFINKLNENGDNVYIITSRAFCTKRNVLGKLFRAMLRSWLKRNGIKYDGIFFCDDDTAADEKLEYCQKLNISWMFEDTEANIRKICEYTRVVCMVTEYNKNVFGERILRINSFRDLDVQKLYI